MMASTLAASVSAWLVGLLIVVALWPRDRSLCSDLPVILPLGLGLGLGVTSVCYFAASLLSNTPGLVSAALEFLLGVALLPSAWRRWRQRAAAPSDPPPGGSKGTVLLGSLLAQACVVALVVTVRAYQAEPYSNSDGWTIWNLHARVLFRGGEDWAALYHRPQLAWTHLDYPLLVSASVARAWAWAGQDAPAAAGLISTLFGVATVGLLVAAVLRLRHPHVAIVGGLVLVGTPFFVTFSSNQHADIPLGFYILAPLVLIALGDRTPRGRGQWLLAGAAAGMAAWTKNEGMLLVVAIGVTGTVLELVRGSRRTAGALLAGLGLALLPVLYFKIAVAPPNDIVSSQPWSRWPHLLDGSRHHLILASLWRDVRLFGEWSILPFVAMALPLLGSGWRRLGRGEWLAGLVPGLMLLGFYFVYLLTPYGLASHLDSSLVRLLLQLWPAAVFFWCLAVTYDAPDSVSTAPNDAPDSRPVHRPRGARGAVLAANLAAAAVVWTLLDRQPAANELATARTGGATINVLLGEGWFGRETYGREVWAWSKGESTLLLRVSGRETRTATLRFSMRSLGARQVTATIGGQIVWSALVREEAERGEIADLSLPPGITSLVFRTDTPGVPESAVPGARPLTYALYNPVFD